MSDQQLTRLRTPVFWLLGVLTACSLLGTALAPYLLVKSPLLLVAVSPAAHHVALAAATVDPIPLISVAALRRTLTGIGAYGLGLLYGRAALGWLDERYPRLARLVNWVERLFKRWGVGILVLAPAPTVALFAGATRAHFALFLLALLLGHALWNSVTYFVGDALAIWTDLLTSFIGEHLLESTLVCIALVTLQQAMSRLFRRRRPVDLGP
ncbi:MAG TPA: VTT domain-containing protein [Polyangiaceae bacterium]|nr:VTT domain-containing protein [Polyangiaceae bacterium]